MKPMISSGEMRKLILAKLSHNFGLSPSEASDEHFYKALVLVLKDILTEKYHRYRKEALKQGTKKVYYLCMEFLMGRSLRNTLFNLGLEESVSSALSNMGVKIESVYEQEPDAGLGNGGLGRLAACFLDGLATQGYNAFGYCLKYEYGIFRQKIVEGWQTELPEFWLPGGDVWLQANPESAITVLFDGRIEEKWDSGYHTINHVDANKICAIPYDLMVVGKGGEAVSKLRLWSAKSDDFDMTMFNKGNYARALEQNTMAEVITKVLYPEDNHFEGKSLRLSQQYFLVSASVQDIIRRHLRYNNSLDNLPETVAIHLNDTHPVLAIPELMRVMLDDCGYSWEHAWDIVNRTVAYTNHTVMSEALECWDESLFKKRLPRIYQIVVEINRRFCEEMHGIGVDGYQVGRMAVLNNGMVKMANLAVIASHSINGVSRLHSEILKESVFHDFYAVMPQKFQNVTNGIAHRRWLNQANPELAGLITELIGDKYIYDASELENLLKYKDDSSVLQRLSQIKRDNKESMAKYIKKHNGIEVNPDSIFDVQVKRLHEYKRQHLNALHLLTTYLWLRENPNAPFAPKTYIFGAKAAPGYYFAKEIIKLIVFLADKINNDPLVNKKLKVVYLENYNVTLAEKLMPAAEISEQISLAGTEASGTSNMKFMINGAITLGTLDGANVEISEAVGRDNIIIFGMTSTEVEHLKKSGYMPATYYYNNSEIKQAIDELNRGINGTKFDDIAQYLMLKDPYFALADFADYAKAQKLATLYYSDKDHWNNMALVNIAKSGMFAADRAIRDYANNIWGAKPYRR